MRQAPTQPPRRGGDVVPFPLQRKAQPWRPTLLGTLFGIELLAWALWLGGMVAIALVAPGIFQQIGSRDLAGRVFGAVLGRLFPMVYVCALVLLGAGAIRLVRIGSVSRLDAARYGLAFFMLVIAGYVGVAVLGEMQVIQAGLPGPIETLSPTMPERVRFNELHKLSERLMGVDMVLGLILLPLLLARRSAAHLAG
jgi:uncharacterized membrane protein